MRIKRFNEQEESIEISTDRVEEILQEVRSTMVTLDKARERATSLSNELSNFRSGSRTANNQVDDASINLDLASTRLSEAERILDDVAKSLDDYKEKGPRYLYG